MSLHRVEHREAGSSHSVQKTWSAELQPNQNCRAALSHYGGKYAITAAGLHLQICICLMSVFLFALWKVLVLLWDSCPLCNLSGAGDSEAESEGGERETAGPAGALQEVFDTTQHSLGQRAAQRAHAEVTPSADSLTRSSLSCNTMGRAGARQLSAPEALEGAGPHLVRFLVGQLQRLTGSNFNSCPVIFASVKHGDHVLTTLWLEQHLHQSNAKHYCCCLRCL